LPPSELAEFLRSFARLEGSCFDVVSVQATRGVDLRSFSERLVGLPAPTDQQTERAISFDILVHVLWVLRMAKLLLNEGPESLELSGSFVRRTGELLRPFLDLPPAKILLV
jgi:hypothetical protein